MRLSLLTGGVSEPNRVWGPAGWSTEAASLLIGRSTHSIDELEQAAAEGCDYAFLSPIYASNSKVGLEGRGLTFLRSATRVATLPVLALGGILPTHPFPPSTRPASHTALCSLPVLTGPSDAAGPSLRWCWVPS